MIRDWINIPRRKPGKPAETSADSRVYLDVVFEKGLLFLELVNDRREPAYEVDVKFDRTLNGVKLKDKPGFKVINQQQLFQGVAFMAPGKKIRTFWEHSEHYFTRDEPLSFGVTVTFHDRSGKAHQHTYHHDLNIYRDLGYISD